MEAPTIKHIKKMSNPHPRKRDGEMLTHVLHLGLTTDEAILISEHFTQFRKEGKPCMSFARLLLLRLAENALTEENLIAEMAKWRTRAKIAEGLAEDEYHRALSLLENAKATKAAKAKPPAPQAKVKEALKPMKVRREYVPEPRNK